MSLSEALLTDVHDWTMPGWEKPGEGCEKLGVGDVFVCKCGNHVAHGSSCNERGCPNCVKRMIAQIAAHLVVQINTVRRSRPAGPDRRVVAGTLRHPDLDAENAHEMMTEAGQVAKDLGWTGHALVVHFWSLTAKANREFDVPKSERWFVLGDRFEDPVEAYEAGYLEYDPHIQFIGLCRMWGTEAPGDWRFDGDTTSFGELTDNNVEDTTQSIYRYTRYLVGHGVFVRGSPKHMIRRYGDLSPQKYSQIRDDVGPEHLYTFRRTAQNLAGFPIQWDEVEFDDEFDDDDAPDDPECDECGRIMDSVFAADWIDDDDGWWSDADPYTRMIFRRLRAIVYGRRRLPPGQRYFDSLDGLIEAIDAQSRREERDPYVEIESTDSTDGDTQGSMEGFVS